MSNVLQIQQSLLDVQDRVNREIQFSEDTQRELLGTCDLLAETIAHLRGQIVRLHNERSASLSAVLGQPGKAQTVDMTAETASYLEKLRQLKEPSGE